MADQPDPRYNDKGVFVPKDYGILGAIREMFNAAGATASLVNNTASGAAEFTSHLPELGHIAGKDMKANAKASLEAQRLVANQS